MSQPCICRKDVKEYPIYNFKRTLSFGTVFSNFGRLIKFSIQNNVRQTQEDNPWPSCNFYLFMSINLIFKNVPVTRRVVGYSWVTKSMTKDIRKNKDTIQKKEWVTKRRHQRCLSFVTWTHMKKYEHQKM